MQDITLIKKEFNKTEFSKKWIEQLDKPNKAIFDREVSFAIQHITANPYLLKCTKESILKSVLNIAQTDLTLNPVMHFAYLVPRKINQVLECVLDPSYQGLVKLLTDSGSVTSISCNPVYEGDEIDFDFSSQKKVNRHTPYFILGKEKGNLKSCYSLATLHDGSYHCEIMSIQDIYDIRDRSEAYKAFKNGRIKFTPWVTDEQEMSRKTVVKRHFKFLPKSDKTDKLSHAIHLDNIANGYDEPVGMNEIGLIESLIDSSILSPELQKKAYDEMMSIEWKSQALKLIKKLKENQGDPRDNLSTQKNVNKAIDKAIELDTK